MFPDTCDETGPAHRGSPLHRTGFVALARFRSGNQAESSQSAAVIVGSLAMPDSQFRGGG